MSGILGVLLGSNGAASGDASETTAFLARTSGLDAAHTNAYKALINGLVSDGVFSKLDALYILATADATTAALSLVSATYNATVLNSPTFTADAGYTFSAGTQAFNANFTPSSASSPKFTQNSGHVSVWSNTSASNSSPLVRASGSGNNVFLYPRQTSTAFFGVNDGGAFGTSVANTDGSGHYIANRSDASNEQGYKNGSQVVTHAQASAAVDTTTLQLNGNWTGQAMAFSIGSSMSGGSDAANLYARIHTFLQTIAGIA